MAYQPYAYTVMLPKAMIAWLRPGQALKPDLVQKPPLLYIGHMQSSGRHLCLGLYVVQKGDCMAVAWSDPEA